MARTSVRRQYDRDLHGEQRGGVPSAFQGNRTVTMPRIGHSTRGTLHWVMVPHCQRSR